MGVTGLWQIVQPCARPIKIETLNRKRLAVDASIWIYQFLKAVRDKEGNALRNSHVVGFFRRICKLLFFGIKPVFVFDGGAPALKRQTIRARKSRREGRRDDAARTAGKLLAVQMQRRAEEEEAQRRTERDRRDEQEETVPDEGLVYVDELQMTQQERQQNRKFRKKDQYHLPNLDVSLSEMGGANDPRVMSLEELQTYARQFDTGEDINVYDFSKIDYDSPFFMSLPASDRYNILNAARLRSRLRMGYSKDQLDTMYPDRMAFSKFQIERVRERNELTQRLMHLNGFEGAEFGGGRVAGEKGREYVLVKNDGVEGGWALGVITDEGKEEMPIDVDRPARPVKQEQDDWEDDEDDFEDVPVAGLNRLPKRPTKNEQVADKLLEQRRAVYSSRKQSTKRKSRGAAKKDRSELFVQSSEDEEEWEEVDADNDLSGEHDGDGSEDEELRQAIAMSLQKEDGDQTRGSGSDAGQEEDDDMLEVFQQSAVEEQKPVPKGSGRDIASIVNKRAFNTAPDSREITSFGVPREKSDESDEDDTMDLQAALAESRKTKRKTSPPRRSQAPSKPSESAADIAKQAGFKGPLPFEKLDLGSSLLGKKKMQERTEEAAGGFENPQLAEKQNKTAEPLPPWFSGDLEADMQAQNAIESEDRRKAREFESSFQFQDRGVPTLRRDETNEVIDLEAGDVDEPSREIIDLDEKDSATKPSGNEETDPPLDVSANVDDLRSASPDRNLNMGDLADEVRAEPEKANPDPSADMADAPPVRRVEKMSEQQSDTPSPATTKVPGVDEEDEVLDWSDSDRDDGQQTILNDARGPPALLRENDPTTIDATASAPDIKEADGEDEDLGFEDVEIPDAPPIQPEQVSNTANERRVNAPQERPALPVSETIPEDDDEFDDFSDPEEAEMLRQLTLEAEEHARFASSLNNKSTAQNIQEYEKELKQLRNQQKKDRRDADEVTQIMIQECQALLRLFGLPYITAPMEAEAQCAELVAMGLVDGIVTDDSDCFLFGGTRIYKNMFNQAKFVECYLTSDLEKEFDLSRDKLIAVAHLLGSDYTEGIPGIGPVTALEIISEFGSLSAFRDWWTAVQMNQIPKEEDAKNPFRKKFRRNATKMFLPPGFPDERVNIAYNTPDVDHNPEAFQWGVPDLSALRSFLMATIGWTQERTDEVLVPVIKDMNRRLDEGTQANITHFFDGAVGIGAAGASNNASRGEGFAPRKRAEGSKRMGNALTKMAERAKRNRSHGDSPTAEVENSVAVDDEEPVTTKKNTAKRRKTKASTSGTASDDAKASDDDNDDRDFNETRMKKTKGRKQPRATRGKARNKNQEEAE